MHDYHNRIIVVMKKDLKNRGSLKNKVQLTPLFVAEPDFKKFNLIESWSSASWILSSSSLFSTWFDPCFF